MAKASAVRAGRAYIEIFADSSQLVRGMRLAEKQITAFGQRITGIGLRVAGLGAAIATPLLAAAKNFSDVGDQLDKLSVRTGASVEFLSEMGFAAEQSGASLDDVGKGFQVMARTVDDAAQGSSAAAKALNRIGLSIADVFKLNPELRFLVIADAISKIEDAGTQAAIAMEIFGRGGASLLPLFKEGATGIEALRTQFRDLGLTVSTADAALAARFNDSLSLLTRVAKNVVLIIGAQLAPTLDNVIQKVIAASSAFTEWTKGNKALFAGLLLGGAALVVIGKALIGVGIAVFVAGKAVGGLLVAFKAVGVVVGLATAAIGLLMNPIGLAIVAVGILSAYFVDFGAIVRRVTDAIGRGFRKLSQLVPGAFEAIRDALTAGDLVAASEILWASLQVVWHKGMIALQSAWGPYWAGLNQTAAEAGFLMVQQMANWWKEIRIGWNEIFNWAQSQWQKVKGLRDELEGSTALQMALRSVDANERAGKISAATAAQQRADIEDIYGGMHKSIEDENKKALDQINKDHKDNRDRIESDFRNWSSEMARDLAEQVEAISKGLESGLADSENALDEAKKQLEAAVIQANKARGDAAVEKLFGAGVGGLQSIGGFNLSRTLGFQSISGTAEKQLQYTKQIAENTRNMGVRYT